VEKSLGWPLILAKAIRNFLYTRVYGGDAIFKEKRELFDWSQFSYNIVTTKSIESSL